MEKYCDRDDLIVDALEKYRNCDAIYHGRDGVHVRRVLIALNRKI